MKEKERNYFRPAAEESLSLVRVPFTAEAGATETRVEMSVHTVNTHRQRIYAKMDVRNVADMLHKARELGIL